MNIILSEIKNNRFEFVKLKSAKEALDSFVPQTGAESELKLLISLDDFAFDKYCISTLAYKLIEDEKKSDPDFNDQEANSSLTDHIQRLFSNNFNVEQSWLNKLSPTERSIAYSLIILKEQLFNEDYANRGLNEKLAILLMNGSLISSEYEAVKIENNLQENKNRYEQELKEQKEKSNDIFIEKTSYKLFLNLIKTALNRNMADSLKAVKVSNCL